MKKLFLAFLLGFLPITAFVGLVKPSKRARAAGAATELAIHVTHHILEEGKNGETSSGEN